MKKILLLLILISAFTLSHVNYKYKQDIKQGEVFATYYKIISLGKNTIMPDIEKVFAEVNAKMSVFQAESEINMLNNAKAGVELAISPELYEILEQSKNIYTQTQGYFDPSLGTLIDLWGFGRIASPTPPSSKQIENALLDVGMDKLSLGENTAIKARDNLRLNLSAIAKGYAVDRVAQVLLKAGYKDFLIDIGGEVYARGKASIWGKSWLVGITNPSSQGEALIYFELHNNGIATSGDYENFIEKDGQRYSHILAPKTGTPHISKLASVSVFDKSLTLADAYATALMAMGEKKAILFAQENNINAIFFIRQGDDFIIIESPAKKH